MNRVRSNEFAKMRHLRVGVVATIMVFAVGVLALYTAVSGPDFHPDIPDAWNALLAGMSLAVPMISPLLLAVLASRQTDIEYQGNGWLWQATAGVAPGRVCRGKFAALGLVVTVVTLGTSLLVLATGKLLIGLVAPVPLGHWVGFTVCVLVVHLVLLALHILLSARLENQLVALGVGVIGCVVAVFSQGLPSVAAHSTPWGYYALAKAGDYATDRYVTAPISYASIAGLAVVAGVLFAVVTRRFDRREV